MLCERRIRVDVQNVVLEIVKEFKLALLRVIRRTYHCNNRGYQNICMLLFFGSLLRLTLHAGLHGFGEHDVIDVDVMLKGFEEDLETYLFNLFIYLIYLFLG